MNDKVNKERDVKDTTHTVRSGDLWRAIVVQQSACGDSHRLCVFMKVEMHVRGENRRLKRERERGQKEGNL